MVDSRAINPLLKVFAHSLFDDLSLDFRPKLIGLVTLGKPLQIAKRPIPKLFGYLNRLALGLGAVVERVPPVRTLPEFPPVPVETKCWITMSIHFDLAGR